MHDFIKLQVINTQLNFQLIVSTTTYLPLLSLAIPVRPVSNTGQTGPTQRNNLPVRPVPPTGLTQSKPRNLGAAKIAHQLQIPSRI